MVFWPPPHDISTPIPMVFWPPSPSMVFWPPYPWYIDNLTHGISTLLPMVFWPPIHGIKTHLPMVFWPPTNGIWSPKPMVYWPTTRGILTPYQWYIDPPTHGILTPYPWYFDSLPMVHRPPIHGILTSLPMVYRIPYPWYFDPLPISWLEMTGVKIPWGFKIPWHRSFLHSWPITGFVIRLTWRVPLVEQEQLTFPEHPSSVPDFSGVCVTRSLVLCVCFVDQCLSFCPFLPLCCPSFDLRILITPFGFGILKLFLRKAVIHFPIGSYVKNCQVSGS
jgi:hypothetical protein